MSRAMHGAVVLAALSVTGLARAATWNGGAGNWSSNAATGWNGTGVPDAVDAVGNIAAATGNITVDGSYALGTLQSGNAFNNRTLLNAAGTLTFDVSAGNALFDLSNGGVAGSGINVAPKLSLTDTLEVRNLVNSGSQTATVTGAVSGAGGLSLVNTGTTGGGFRFDLWNATNSFAGGVTVGAGVGFRISASNAMGTGTLTRASSAAAGTNDISFRDDAGNATQVHANPIALGSNVSGSSTTFALENGSMNVTLNGAISGTMGGTQRANLNGGTLVLGSANTWTGQFRSDSHGTVVTTAADAIDIGFSMRTAVQDQTTALLIGATDTITGTIATEGNNSGGAAAYTARLGLRDGNNGTVTFNSGTKINLITAGGIGATIAGTGNAATVSAISLTNPSLNLHSGNGFGTLAVTTDISTNPNNPRNISITGTGTVNLNRAAGNSYEGSTTVAGGTLLVNNVTGSGTSTGAVNVNGGGTLGGTGIIATANNAVTVAAGGKLAPGAGAGVLRMNLGTASLNISGAVAATNSQSMLFQLDGLAEVNDKVTLTAASTVLNIGGGTLEFDDFTFTNLGDLQEGVYTLFDTANGITGSLGSNLSGPIGAFTGTLSLASSNQDVVLTVAAVPEPASLGLLALGGLAMTRRRRTC